MAFWKLFKRTAPEPEPLAPHVAPIEPGALVICTGPRAEYAGVALNYDFTGEIFVRYYDREWKAWFSGWWQADQVRPMMHGLTADEAREIACALLETGKLPD